jgi:endo-beta-N-acetylglucosaminidase D
MTVLTRKIGWVMKKLMILVVMSIIGLAALVYVSPHSGALAGEPAPQEPAGLDQVAQQLFAKEETKVQVCYTDEKGDKVGCQLGKEVCCFIEGSKDKPIADQWACCDLETFKAGRCKQRYGCEPRRR